MSLSWNWSRGQEYSLCACLLRKLSLFYLRGLHAVNREKQSTTRSAQVSDAEVPKALSSGSSEVLEEGKDGN